MSDATYMPKVYRKQGGDEMVIASGGLLTFDGGSVTGLTPGDNFFVSSVTGSSSNDGLSWGTAKATLAQALALCTASKNDRIFLAPDHAETISAAAGININVAGVSIIGIGNGRNRPTFTWSATDSTVTVTAANVSIYNIRCTSSVDECVSLWSVSAAGVAFDRVDYFETASAQAIQFLLTTNAADYLTIKNCHHAQNTAAGSAQKWIQLVGPDYAVITDNIFLLTLNASTSSCTISGSTAVVFAVIANNLIVQTGATINTVVNCVTGSTGIIADNRAGSGTSVATAGAFTGDGMFMFNNYWADTAAASGLLAPAVDTDT